jgi:hypothetical protein
MTKKVHIVKKNPAPAKPANVDPGQLGQYSAQNQVSESASLDQYLKSRGINPANLPIDTKIAHAKSAAFLSWKRNHEFREDRTLDKGPTHKRQQEILKSKDAQKVVRGPGSQTTMLTPEHIVRTGKPSALDKFRKAAAERQKKHDEIQKKQSKDGSGMTSAIDRLEKHLNKEDINAELKQKLFNQQRRKALQDKGLLKPPTQKEDVGDAKAATNADGLPNAQLEPVSEKKRQMSKSARMIKAIYKKHRMVKEDMFDHEKEDKSVATYGKKPKFEKADEKDSKGEKKPQAAAVMTGGTTLTGEKRDDVEIDPMMRNRPGQPDVTKKDDKKDDKKNGNKKDK